MIEREEMVLRIAELEDALRPFAELLSTEYKTLDWLEDRYRTNDVSMGMLRNAARVLNIQLKGDPMLEKLMSACPVDCRTVLDAHLSSPAFATAPAEAQGQIVDVIKQLIDKLPWVKVIAAIPKIIALVSAKDWGGLVTLIFELLSTGAENPVP